ncbi:uncharacterized protein LOC143604632, partial [Bidens hawaiensis]|uniref:uncharacterized protein LOC143604632 n=1 Tax=Bidens hawaiensis TaxID=980011 RepID=UPI00404A0645
MDLTDSMPRAVDQAAKLGSMAFMCTIMANVLPSLATMDSKELLTNTIALQVLVITLVVNVFIQTETGQVPNYEAPYFHIVIFNTWKVSLSVGNVSEICESKYKACHEIALKDLELQQPTVEKLKQHVRNHWIMAGTGSPQFMTWLTNVLVEIPFQVQHNKDLSMYVLQLQDDMKLAMRTLKSISKSVNHVIQKAEKHKPNYLVELIEEYSGFEGVGKYDMHQVSLLTEEKYMDCWSLPIVTLTAVAMSLPNIQKDIVDRLLMCVSEGLTYVTHIVETLNASEEYVSIQKAATMLWLEVEVYHKWLGYKLPSPHLQVNATKEIVQWFSDTAKNMVTEVENKNMKDSDDNTTYMSASANSMYRITQTILVSYQAEIDQISQEELFMQLSSMISNILAACLTNLPQSHSNEMPHKCYTEKRDVVVDVDVVASVDVVVGLRFLTML